MGEGVARKKSCQMRHGYQKTTRRMRRGWVDMNTPILGAGKIPLLQDL